MLRTLIIILVISSVLITLEGTAQEKFLRIKGEVVDRFTNKEKVKEVDIFVVNANKDTIIEEYSRNGKFSIWLPVGTIMSVYFFTSDYYPKYFIVDTKSVPEYYRSETYAIDAEVSLTPYDEAIKDATPFDEPMGYVNFSSGKKVFYWDENYTNEIRRYMNVAYLEQAKLKADQWIDNERVFTLTKDMRKIFVVPSASTFVLRYVFDDSNVSLAMNNKNLRKAKLVKEFGIILGGMIEVDKAYLYQFGEKEEIQEAENLVYTVTNMKKSNERDLYIVPKKPEIYLAENLFFKIGQWMEVTNLAIQTRADKHVLIWNMMAQILMEDDLEVASYLSDSILSFMADVTTFRQQCVEFEDHVSELGEEAFKEKSTEWLQLKSNFKTLYSRL